MPLLWHPYAWAVRRVVLAETSGLRARGEDSIARNALSFSLPFSPQGRLEGRGNFRRSMQNIRPAVPTRVIRGRSVKPSSGNLYNRPLPPISLMVISNRKLLFTIRRTLFLARRRAGCTHKGNRNRYPYGFRQDLFYRGSFSARRQISSGPQTRSANNGNELYREESRVKVDGATKPKIPRLLTWKVNNTTKH